MMENHRTLERGPWRRQDYPELPHSTKMFYICSPPRVALTKTAVQEDVHTLYHISLKKMSVTVLNLCFIVNICNLCVLHVICIWTEVMKVLEESNLHEISDEKVVLQSTNSFLWQNGRLPTHWTWKRQRLRGNVVLETTGEKRINKWRKREPEQKIYVSGYLCMIISHILFTRTAEREGERKKLEETGVTLST